MTKLLLFLFCLGLFACGNESETISEQPSVNAVKYMISKRNAYNQYQLKLKQARIDSVYKAKVDSTYNF